MADELQISTTGGVTRLILKATPTPSLTIDPDCCCSGRVLFWLANSEFSVTMLGAEAIYTGMGLTVNYDTSWTGTLNDYALVVWPFALTDPTWWSQISGDTWRGRLAVFGEHSGFPGTNTYLNSVSGVTGVTIVPDFIDGGCGKPGTVEPDALTAGQTPNLYYGLTSQVSGGTTLSKTVTGAHPWIARSKPATNTEFVVAGDSNWITDGCDITVNTQFLKNLWTVPLL